MTEVHEKLARAAYKLEQEEQNGGVKMAKDSEIDKIEKRHPDMLFIPSDAKGLCYATTARSRNVYIISGQSAVKVGYEQIKALLDELDDVYMTFAGRGKVNMRVAHKRGEGADR